MNTNTIQIGNTAEKISSGSWKCSLYVTGSTENIHGIKLEIAKNVESKNYELEKSEGGGFHSEFFSSINSIIVLVHLYLKNGTENEFSYLLVCNEDGGEATYALEGAKDEVNERRGVVTRSKFGNMVIDTKHIEHLTRNDVQYRLSNVGFQDYSSTAFWHGRLYSGKSTNPKATWTSNLSPRHDRTAPKWLTASEYRDEDDVLETKLEYLVQLLKLSKRTVVYSGAGISKAAGISQAARGVGEGGRKGLDALPTFTHYGLGALANAGYIHNWIQQNHDGLPQKAGFPQESINEIHGSWYDPSNPVVSYGGSIKDDLYPWLSQEANTADLVLVLGTSLGGLNADRVAIDAALRSRKERNYNGGGALGMVLINLQQTQQDGKSTIRIFGQSDDVLESVLKKLNVPSPMLKPATFSHDKRVLVPYEPSGKRSTSTKMWLDLREGALLKLTDGHNCQGSKQQSYKHIGSDKPAHGEVIRYNNTTIGIEIMFEGQTMVLGQWWIDAAIRGGPTFLPVVNVKPETIKAPSDCKMILTDLKDRVINVIS